MSLPFTFTIHKIDTLNKRIHVSYKSETKALETEHRNLYIPGDLVDQYFNKEITDQEYVEAITDLIVQNASPILEMWKAHKYNRIKKEPDLLKQLISRPVAVSKEEVDKRLFTKKSPAIKKEKNKQKAGEI